jgi:hypothetical protein
VTERQGAVVRRPLIYEPYLPWSCDVCGQTGRLCVPSEWDVECIECAMDEAHAIANPECPAKSRSFRVGKLEQPKPLEAF